jgi:hypothetical protein
MFAKQTISAAAKEDERRLASDGRVDLLGGEL